MKHTKEEIINALRIIKDECATTNCEDCPFGDLNYISATHCKLKRVNPVDWEINDIPPQTWRALK